MFALLLVSVCYKLQAACTILRRKTLTAEVKHMAKLKGLYIQNFPRNIQYNNQCKQAFTSKTLQIT